MNTKDLTKDTLPDNIIVLRAWVRDNCFSDKPNVSKVCDKYIRTSQHTEVKAQIERFERLKNEVKG
jgi:hypothetical protein